MALDEFLDITPRFFQALVDRDKARCERQQEMTEVMGAQIVAMVRRCGLVQFEEFKSFLDFMPTRWRREGVKGKERPKRQTKAEKLKEIAAIRQYWKLAVAGKTVKA